MHTSYFLLRTSYFILYFILPTSYGSTSNCSTGLDSTSVLSRKSQVATLTCTCTPSQGCATIDCITIYCNILLTIYCNGQFDNTNILYWSVSQYQYIVLLCLTISIYCIDESNNTNIVQYIVLQQNCVLLCCWRTTRQLKEAAIMMLNCPLPSEHLSNSVSKIRLKAASTSTRGFCFQLHVWLRDSSPWQNEYLVLTGAG